MKRLTVELSTEIAKRYEHTSYFCPACGQQQLWAELIEGDVGHSGIYGCSACHECMSMNVWVEGETVPTHRLDVSVKRAA